MGGRPAHAGGSQALRAILAILALVCSQVQGEWTWVGAAPSRAADAARCCCCGPAPECHWGCDRAPDPGAPTPSAPSVACACGKLPAPLPKPPQTRVEWPRDGTLIVADPVSLPADGARTTLRETRMHDPPPDIAHIQTVVQLI